MSFSSQGPREAMNFSKLSAALLILSVALYHVKATPVRRLVTWKSRLYLKSVGKLELQL